jgi:hypothetical protein
MRNKKELKALIADGLLTEAAQSAVEYAEAAADTDTLNGLLSLQSELSVHHKLWGKGEMIFEEYARAQARISSGLLGRVDELPESPTVQARKERLPETTFKWRLFYLFCGAKLFVLVFVLLMWQTYGFQNSEAFSLFNALLPGLVVNVSFMYRHLLKSGMEGNGIRRYVPVRFQTVLIVALCIYTAVQFVLVVQKIKGNLSFEMASLSFVAVELVLGQVMSEMLEDVFKRNPN